MSGKSILVLGATGECGTVFTKTALAQSTHPNLTLYVRSRAKVSAEALSHPAVRVVEGSLTDEQALGDAMAGVDTVVSFLGAPVSLSAFIWRTTTTPIADSLATVFQAMRAQGVKRILALSTAAYSVASERKSWGFWFFGLMIPLVVPQGNAEMLGIARNVAAQSDLDWTAFRVPHLNDGSADLPVAAGLLGPDYKGTLELSRLSLARWILEEVEKPEWIKSAPALGNY